MIKYKEIAECLKKRVINGTYPVNKSLPEQSKLAKEFNVSRVTIQKALDILVLEGFIYSRQGSGTFVMKNIHSKHLKDINAEEYIGTTAHMKGHQVESKIIKFSIDFPTKNTMDKLMITSSEPVYDIIRLRLVNGMPFSLEYTLMPINIITGITEDILKKSIYSYIKNELKLELGSAYRKIYADKPTEDDKMYLNCQNTDPVLGVNQVVYLKDGLPFELSKSKRRYDEGIFTYINIQ